MSLRTGALTTREKLIRAGREIFYRDGFHCAGLDQVLREAGLTKTTFYNHFSSKEELIQEVIDYHEAKLRERFREVIDRVAGDGTPLDRLKAVFEVMQQYFDMDQYNGCMMINAALVFPIPEDPINVAAMRNKKLLNQQLADLAQAANIPNQESFLKEFEILFDGTVISRHIFGNQDAAKVGARLFANLIDRYLDSAEEIPIQTPVENGSRMDPGTQPLPQKIHSPHPIDIPPELLSVRKIEQN